MQKLLKLTVIVFIMVIKLMPRLYRRSCLWY